jgi:hypothetical protein
VEVAVRSINIRPWRSRIFEDCEASDLISVKGLFEAGSASINDVAEYGHKSILEVSTHPGPLWVEDFLSAKMILSNEN